MLHEIGREPAPEELADKLGMAAWESALRLPERVKLAKLRRKSIRRTA